MADAHAKNHDYHLVDPEPVAGGRRELRAFILAVGAILWMHGSNPAIMLIGFVGVCSTPCSCGGAMS